MQVAPAIKERMMKKGSLMLGYQPHQGKVNFFRQVVISPQVSREDMDFLLDEIDLLGKSNSYNKYFLGTIYLLATLSHSVMFYKKDKSPSLMSQSLVI